MTAEARANCEELFSRLSQPPPQDNFFQNCLCVLGGQSAENCTGRQYIASATPPTVADQVVAEAQNGTVPSPGGDDDDDVDADDNLINSDVFIYVIVFIVIVYFLTFLYLCMKKRQREAEDAEAGRGGRPRPGEDLPPAYDEVVRGAEGGDKCAEPPTYAEVLARSQQLDKLEATGTTATAS